MAKAKNGSSEFEAFARRPPKLRVLTVHPLKADQARQDTFDLHYRVGSIYDIIRHKVIIASIDVKQVTWQRRVV